VKVEKPEYPEVNEEFIEKITGQKKKVEDFKKDVERDLAEFKKGEERKKLENELLEKFLDVTKTEFSDILIDEEVDHMVREMKHDMQHKGLKFEDYLSHLKKTEEDVRKEMKKEANKRITLRFGLHEIMNKEKVEVPEEKVQEQMKQIPNITPENERQIKGQITNSLKITQLFDRFIK
jgi:trigger factor